MKINHGKLDAFLGKVLDAHKTGEVSRIAAIGAIAHVVAAVEKGNESEAHSWLNSEEVYNRRMKKG
ncbi:hypothetical protein [Roseibium sp.]|uniref:hypothetical protein n=1 Tax=Roseibium sp. TaxID=1936156 RepID=UPI003A9754D2